MAVTNEAGLLGLYKIWYTEEKMNNLLFRNSPLARMIEKAQVGGKQFNFPTFVGRGGACAGDMTVAVTAASAGTANIKEFGVTYGTMFSVFTITLQEILASLNSKGAYEPAAVVKMFAALESFRKTFGAALYGSGWGEVGHAVVATTSVGSNIVDFADMSLIVKIDLGTKFRVTNGNLPSDSLRTSVNTVTKIDGTSVTFTATAIETWAATDWVCLEGSRDGSTALLPVGLGGWIPAFDDRTGADWATYIGASFYGVDRSSYVARLAGSFIKRDSGNSEKYVDAIMRGIQAIRTMGGVPDTIVLNTEDYAQVIKEVQAQTTYFSQTNVSASKASKNEVSRGIADMSWVFTSSYLEKTIEDPYCPKGTAYILELANLTFKGLSNSEKPMNDGVQGQDPGVESPANVSAPEMNYKFNIDNCITIKPGVDTVGGPASQVSINLFGNFFHTAPGHACVIRF